MSLLKNPNEISKEILLKGLIYGQPGIGKSTIALTAPNPVCIDFDKGMKRVDPRFQVPSLQVKSYKEVLELLNGSEIANFDTLVIDTLGKLVDRIGDYLCDTNPKVKQADGSLTMRGWGGVKIEFQKFLKLVESKNKHVIFVAHEKEDRGDDKVIKRPDVAGSSGKDIVKELDFMGYMSMIGENRTIDFSPSENFYAKNSLGLDHFIQIPKLKDLKGFIENEILIKAEQRASEKSEQGKIYDTIMEEAEKQIGTIKDADTCNTAFTLLQDLQVLWDSKYQVWKMIQEKAKELNLEYARETKTFVVAEPAKKEESEVPEKKAEETEEKPEEKQEDKDPVETPEKKEEKKDEVSDNNNTSK